MARPDLLGAGYVQLYTGEGKGKTTALVGLSARALGAGLRVFFAQFIKGTPSSEFATLLQAGGAAFTHKIYGMGRFIRGDATAQECALAQQGLREAAAAFETDDVVILDELCYALSAHLVTLEAVSDLIRQRPHGVELVISGRGAPPELIACADLVSTIAPTKHYFSQGVPARKGIEF